MAKYFLIISFFIFFLQTNAGAQTDTVKTEKKLNKKKIYGEARKATIMSAIIPGLGQAYNRKWWKIPIIYAGLGGLGYIFYKNQQNYAYYGKNLKAEYDDDSNTINETKYSGDQLLVLKNDARKHRDMGIAGCAIFYVINIIDANVDAHLKTFDVSDDLSLQIKPYFNVAPANSGICFQNGLSIKLNFK